MGDPTNRNDPDYSGNPNYVWSGGRWQYVSNPATANQPAQGGSVRGESLGTPGGFADVFGGLFDRLSGKPFSSSPVVQDTSVPNAAFWQQIARASATPTPAANPYSTGIADQSRAAILANMGAMRGQLGNSLAGAQGTQAMAQSGQQALQAAASGAPARAAMVNAQQVGGGLANDVARARLGEVMRQQAAMGQAAGGLRANDIQSAQNFAQSGLAAQRAANERAQFYASLGGRMQGAQDRNALENFKLNERLKLAGRQQNEAAANSYIGLLSSLFAGGAGMGK